MFNQNVKMEKEELFVNTIKECYGYDVFDIADIYFIVDTKSTEKTVHVNRMWIDKINALTDKQVVNVAVHEGRHLWQTENCTLTNCNGSVNGTGLLAMIKYIYNPLELAANTATANYSRNKKTKLTKQTTYSKLASKMYR